MPDSLDVIAESYKGLHEHTQHMAATLAHMAQTHQATLALQTTALRLQTFALCLLGLALVGIGVLGWYAWPGRADHAALLHALTLQNQALERGLHR